MCVIREMLGSNCNIRSACVSGALDSRCQLEKDQLEIMGIGGARRGSRDDEGQRVEERRRGIKFVVNRLSFCFLGKITDEQI